MSLRDGCLSGEDARATGMAGEVVPGPAPLHLTVPASQRVKVKKGRGHES